MNFPIRFAIIVAFLYTGLSAAFADGILMTDDFHFKSGENFTLKLTESQIASLEVARVEGELPFPTKLKLTKKQTRRLKKSTGKKVLELNVFEGKYRCCSCCAQNVASRFVPGKLEIAGVFLVDLANLDVYDWEKAVQGGATNPTSSSELNSDLSGGSLPNPSNRSLGFEELAKHMNNSGVEIDARFDRAKAASQVGSSSSKVFRNGGELFEIYKFETAELSQRKLIAEFMERGIDNEFLTLGLDRLEFNGSFLLIKKPSLRNWDEILSAFQSF